MKSYQRHSIRGGATLIEVMVVVVIMSILSATALPAFSMLRDATQSAAVREFRRLLEYARSHAASSGVPTGVLVNVEKDSINLQVFQNGSLEQVPSGTGGFMSELLIADVYDGADLTSITGGVSAAAGESLWFSFDGTPHVRTTTGTLVHTLESTVVYVFADGSTVRVHPVGGMIE
jgi:prepilin-type N-terminal cleavage/methylation domain-containing protein